MAAKYEHELPFSNGWSEVKRLNIIVLCCRSGMLMTGLALRHTHTGALLALQACL